MDLFKTPVKNKRIDKLFSSVIQIPPSPLMQTLGYGTGVKVYQMNRSPISDKARSPWAVKKPNTNKVTNVVKQRLAAEADVLRKLNHPNIVGFRAFTGDETTPCLAMEICTSSLGDLIEERYENDLPPFPSNEINKFVVDISSALKYIHHKALILHCDVKSYNVLVNDGFSACKLCDFGVCLPLKSDGTLDTEKVQFENGILEYTGTGPWCSPEVLEDDPIITAKADIYAFGLVIWEMLALSPPPMDEDCSMNDETIPRRQRPDLPDEVFGEEYFPVLELFYCCTDSDYRKRPDSKDLVVLASNLKV